MPSHCATIRPSRSVRRSDRHTATPFAVRRRIALAAAAACVFVAGPSPSSAQLETPYRPIRFERAAVEPFLPQSSVYVIHQDRRGFLWFGTREGVGRWDGAEMREWKETPFADGSLAGNLVRHLVEDSAGNLWIGSQATDRQPFRVARIVAPDHERIEPYAFEPATPFVDRAGVAWIADEYSLWRFDGSAFDAAMPRITRSAPLAAFMARDGTIWVSAESGALERYAPGRPPEVLSEEEPGSINRDAPTISDFFEDDRGTIWLMGPGLRRLDSTRTRVVSPAALPSPLDTIGTARMLQDPDGWLWVSTLDGVYRFDPALTHFERYPLSLPGDIATQNWALGLARDSSGAVWVGTVWGLHRYDPSADVFGFLEHDPTDPNTIGSGLVLSLHEDPSGSLWVGTLGGGLNRLDRAIGNVRRYRERPGQPDDLGHDWVWTLAGAGDGRVWAGLGDGLALVDPTAARPVRAIDIGTTTFEQAAGVVAMHATGDGGLWLGYGNAVQYRAPDGTRRRYDLPSPADVSAILPDGERYWIATSAGLAHFDPRTGSMRVFRHDRTDRSSLVDDVVISLFRDRSGRLWIGTNNGLDRFEPDSTFTHFGEVDGFPSSVIYSILEDDDRRLWLATNRGLVRFEPDAGAARRVRVYDFATGVGNIEFNRNAAIRGQDGTLYFGGDRGVTFFHPSSLRDNTYRPPVVITALHRSTRDGTRTTRHVGDGPVVLAPDDYTVTFEVAALAFTQPGANRYEYRLEGFDAQWVRAGTNRLASYTNLPPGEYVFRARAANEDGLWNLDGVAVPVVVEPWFWETWWFRGFVVLGVLGAAIAGTSFVQHNRHRVQLERLRHERALEDERARISRDMHDEVGASLTEIAILSELAVRRGAANGSHHELNKIAGRSRRMLDAIGEIIWALNPDHDHPEHLAAYLREYAADYLESTGLRAVLSFEVADTDAILTSEFRRNVFLVMKEALANVARHARAEAVDVALELGEGRLILTVRDDGSGFGATPDGVGHHGLSNMKRRASALGGSLTMRSDPGSGTTATLDVPLPARTRAREARWR
jgi:signal transduction histidine kinase/ligand-binding sensor domain-containing protein